MAGTPRARDLDSEKSGPPHTFVCTCAEPGGRTRGTLCFFDRNISMDGKNMVIDREIVGLLCKRAGIIYVDLVA